MSDRQDMDIGERIQQAVQDAVDSMDFGQINNIVTDTVSGAIDEVRRQVSNVRDGGGRRAEDSGPRWSGESLYYRYRNTPGKGNNSRGTYAGSNFSGGASGQNPYADGAGAGSAGAQEAGGQGTEETGSWSAGTADADSRNRDASVSWGAGTSNSQGRRASENGRTAGTSRYASASANGAGTAARNAGATARNTAGANARNTGTAARNTGAAARNTGTAARNAGAMARNTAGANARNASTAVRVQETGVRINRSGKVGGILMVVFGGIGTGVFALATVLNLIVWAFRQNMSFMPVLMLGLLCAVSCGFIAKGCGIQGRLKRAERYARLGSQKKFLDLEELARQTDSSLKKIRADVRKMLKRGIFPEGHLDKKGSCLILTDETWKQYMDTQREWENRQRLEAAQEEEKQAPETEESQIEKEGRAYMDRLRQLNEEIPGEVISNKLYQLDYLLERIFQVLREHPEKSGQMRRFMDYYLPTTVKLVEAYADFDRAGIQGENIMSAKAEIEKTMDTINQAFEKLLDDMYQAAAMETAADAQVLKTLLAQDGYAKSDFKKKTLAEDFAGTAAADGAAAQTAVQDAASETAAQKAVFSQDAAAAQIDAAMKIAQEAEEKGEV